MSDCKYYFGIDWLNGVLPMSDVKQFFSDIEQFSNKLRFCRWQLESSGKYNYARRYCLEGQATFQVMFNPLPLYFDDYRCLVADMDCNNSGIFLSISGDGLRKLASMGQPGNSALNKLLFYLYRNGFKASRYDVYCDILDEKNKVVPLLTKAFRYFVQPRVGFPTLTTNMQRLRHNVSVISNQDDNGKTFYNVALGHHGSSTFMFRCYNKRMEIMDGRLSEYKDQLLSSYGNPDYCYRMEYEIHKNHASDYFNATMKQAEESNENISYQDCFLTCFDRCFTPVLFKIVASSRLCSLPASDPWVEFRELISSSSGKLFILSNSTLPYVEMSKERLNRYIKRNSSFVYALFTAVLFQPDLIFSVLSDGQDRFHKKKKYLPLLDDLAPDFDSAHYSEVNTLGVLGALHSSAKSLSA